MNYLKNCYIIRHCRPDFGLDERYCLGHTDMALGSIGRKQALLLAEKIKVSKVYSSPLKRAFQTAEYLSDDIEIVPDFIEAYAGEWDGLSFEEIEKKWPELYALRAFQPVEIPGCENKKDAQERFRRALENLPDSDEPVAIVAHASVLEGIVGKKMAYGEYCFEGKFYQLTGDDINEKNAE